MEVKCWLLEPDIRWLRLFAFTGIGTGAKLVVVDNRQRSRVYFIPTSVKMAFQG